MPFCVTVAVGGSYSSAKFCKTVLLLVFELRLFPPFVGLNYIVERFPTVSNLSDLNLFDTPNNSSFESEEIAHKQEEKN